MRRRRLRWVVAGLAVLVVVGSVVALPRPVRVAREDVDRIQVGMSRVEVEAILGPPGDYTTGQVVFDCPPGGFILVSLPPDVSEPIVQWDFDTAHALMTFDEAERVSRKLLVPAKRIEQKPLENLLWRIRRQWRRWFP